MSQFFDSLISGGNSVRSDSNPCALHGCDAFSCKDQGGGLSNSHRCVQDYGWTFSKSHKGCEGFCNLLLSFLYYCIFCIFLYSYFRIPIFLTYFPPQTQPGPGLGSSSRVCLDVFDPSLHGGRSPRRRMAHGWRAAPGCHQCRVSLSLHHTCLGETKDPKIWTCRDYKMPPGSGGNCFGSMFVLGAFLADIGR